MWVTPALARTWLDLNEENRKLRDNHAAAFARDMASGNWHEEVIAGVHFVDDTGKLGDGQHRLHAIEQSGEPQWMLVRSVPAEAIVNAVDRGARRNVVDALHFAGFSTTPVRAALARKIIQMDAGFAPGGAGRLKPTDAEIKAVLIGPNAELVNHAADVAMQIRKADALKARPGNVAIAYYQAAKIDKDAAREFFETQLLKSEGLVFESPANALRRRLQNAVGKKMNDTEQYNYIVHAWNHYRRGTLLSRLQSPDSWGPTGYATPI